MRAVLLPPPRPVPTPLPWLCPHRCPGSAALRLRGLAGTSRWSLPSWPSAGSSACLTTLPLQLRACRLWSGHEHLKVREESQLWGHVPHTAGSLAPSGPQETLSARLRACPQLPWQINE